MRFGHDQTTGEQVHPIDIGLGWDSGAPEPVLIQSEFRTFLAFGLAATALKLGPLTALPPEEPNQGEIGIVEWLDCRGAVLGGLNDEALHGHALWSSGLADAGHYGAAEVMGSAWIRELEAANRVHPLHRPERFERLRHFILGFHDSTFECIADGYDCYLADTSMRTVVAALADLVGGREPVPFARLG